MTVMKGVAIMNRPDEKKVRAVIRKRNQITLGKEIMDQIGITEGDAIEFVVRDGILIGIPLEVKPKNDQSWYWSEGWQTAEKSVDEWLEEGGLKNSPTFTADEFLEEMKRRSK